MEINEQEQLKSLLAPGTGPFVSIFFPTYRKGKEIQQNPIRMKNLLREAESQLERFGKGNGRDNDLLAGAEALVDDHEFWQHQDRGLAVFLSNSGMRYVRVPFEPGELVISHPERFHIKPILPLLTDDAIYHVLTLSHNNVRLLECHRFGAREVDLEGTSIPSSMAEALKYDDPEKQLQYHSSTSPALSPPGSNAGLIFHGHGVVDEDKEDLKRYFIAIDRGLRELLDGGRAPLVLAGVDYLLPIYGEVNRHPGLMAEGVTGNPDRLRPEELHQKSWPIAEAHFRKDREAALERFRELIGKGQASQDIREIVRGAHNGRVDSLFVAVRTEVWGSFDTAKQKVLLHDEPKPGDGDLLDLAAQLTLANGGAVFSETADGIPDSRPLAAIFRY